MKETVIHAIPMGAPRMTQRDKWAKRKIVVKYFAFRDLLKLSGYTMKDTLNITFYCEMPKTWSNKKKSEQDGKPHDQKPDIDNLLKAFMDAFGEDKTVHTVIAKKVWSKNPRIVIHE